MTQICCLLSALLIGLGLLLSASGEAFAHPLPIHQNMLTVNVLAPPPAGDTPQATTNEPVYLPATGEDNSGALLLMVFGGLLLILAGLGLNLTHRNKDEAELSKPPRKKGPEARFAR